ASALQPLVPNRVVDTRVNLGTSKLIGGSPRRIQITGVGGVPAGATAALVNVTATGAGAPGFLTLWNCGVRPDVSTLNFLAGETVPNSASVPLDSTGGLCAYAWSTTDMVIDVTGYYSSAGTARYNPVVPARLMDTRVPIGPSGRLAGGQTVELQVTGSGGVPAGATAVALNVTSDDASSDGYVTVYPCSSPRPDASSLNPKVDKSRANLVVTKLSPTGTVCLFTLRPTELVVDAFGYYSASGTMFTAATPFRFTDTRQTFNNDLNGGLGGARLNAGQVLTIPMAGIRGVPASAKAISANVTVTEADGPGWLAAWPCGPRSGISTVNFGWVTPVANAAIMPLSSSGSICVLSYTNAHVVIDVNGWWA
ncbi:MAG: hypothetical protein ABIQ39_04565, partial [Ilumatobacteraceae bacterium]